MATNPLQKAIDSAVRSNDTVGGLFARMGTSAHPRGFLPLAYKNATRAMKTVLTEVDPITGARDVIRQLKDTVERETRSLFLEAQSLGLEESARQLRFYGIEARRQTGVMPMELTNQSNAAVSAVSAALSAQEAQILAMILADMEDGQIVGDDNRDGVLSESEMATAIAFWAAFLFGDAFGGGSTGYGLDFSKIAVAAIDGRTTNCCLNVHGQIQPFDSPFHLTGTPRFADYMDAPPFHYWCRTATALYLPAFDTGIVDQMRASANWFLSERRAGRSPDRDPANAF